MHDLMSLQLMWVDSDGVIIRQYRFLGEKRPPSKECPAIPTRALHYSPQALFALYCSDFGRTVMHRLESTERPEEKEKGSVQIMLERRSVIEFRLIKSIGR